MKEPEVERISLKKQKRKKGKVNKALQNPGAKCVREKKRKSYNAWRALPGRAEE